MLAPWWYGGGFDPARYGLATVLLLATAAAAWKRGTPLYTEIVWPAAALAAWALVQALVISTSPVRSVESTIVLAANLGVLVFWAHEAREEKHARQLAYAVLFSCAAQAAFAVVQASWMPGAVYGRHLEEVQSPFGSFLNHNHFAGFMEMGAVLALGLALGRAKRAETVDSRTVAFVGLSVALAGAHLASRSRGGLLALLAGAFAVAALWSVASSRQRRAAGRVLITASVASIALVAFGWFAVPHATRVHLATSFKGPSDGSGHYRMAMAGASLLLWKAHFLAGSGLGTFEDAVAEFKRSDGSVRAAHGESDILEFAAEGGVIGLALLAWLATAIVGGFRDRMTHGHDPWRKGLAVGAVGAVACLVAHALFDFNLRIPSNALVFSALAGLAAAPRSETTRHVSTWATRAIVLAMIVLGLAALWRTAGAVESTRARAAASPHERLGRLSRLLERHPYLPSAYRERAHVRWQLVQGTDAIAQFRRGGAIEDLRACVRLRPAWAYPWADLGWLHFMEGNPVAAKEAFARAAALDPASVSVGRARAEFYFRTGDPASGLQELRRIRGLNPDWPEGAAQAIAKRWGQAELK